MKPSLPAHVSNLCRELVQARNDLTEFTARAEEMIGVLKEHIHLLQILERRRATNKPIYIPPRGGETIIH